jgi:hypothetical protein
MYAICVYGRKMAKVSMSLFGYIKLVNSSHSSQTPPCSIPINLQSLGTFSWNKAGLEISTSLFMEFSSRLFIFTPRDRTARFGFFLKISLLCRNVCDARHKNHKAALRRCGASEHVRPREAKMLRLPGNLRLLPYPSYLTWGTSLRKLGSDGLPAALSSTSRKDGTPKILR